MCRIQVLLIHVNTLSVSFHLSSSLLPSCWQRGKQNVENAPKRGEIAHVYNRTNAWVIAHLSNTDCDDRWSDRLQLIPSPWMHSLVLQHLSMHFRYDERAMAPHGVGWAACPWIGAENSPDTDIGLKWWSFLLSWKDSTPTSFLFIFVFFFLFVLFTHTPLVFLQVFFFKWHHHVSSLNLYSQLLFAHPASLIAKSMLKVCEQGVAGTASEHGYPLPPLPRNVRARTCMSIFFRLTLHKHTSFHLSHLNLCWSTATKQASCQETSRTICRNLLL